jgi:integrase/recombinase XerD
LFPRLLKDPSILPEDKIKIKELLKKPWNPYIRRHSALTQKSKILKEHVLRQHAGWSVGSDMPQKYLHYFGNESSESILEAYGLKPKTEEIDKMKPKQCPDCSESNKIDSKFCFKCRMVLSYDAYTEAVEQNEKQSDKIAKMEEKQEKFEMVIQSLIDSGQLKAKD